MSYGCLDGMYQSFRIQQAEEQPSQEQQSDNTERDAIVPDIQCPLSAERLAALQH